MAIDPRRIPIIGDDIYQVGQVYDVVSQPCAPDPWIAVRAFWTYTPQLLWSLFKPDWGDLTFTRAGRSHHRKRRRRFRLDGAMLAPEPKGPGIGTALFPAYQLAQRIGWYLIVVDATTDFLVNWSSMTWEYSGCASGLAQTGWYKSDGHELAILAPGAWAGTAGLTFHQEYPVAASYGALNLRQDRPHTVRATVVGHTTEWNGMNGGMTGARLLRNRGGGKVDIIPLDSSWESDGTSAFTAALNSAHTISTGWEYQLETQWGGGRCHIDHLHVELTAAPSAGIEHDP